MRLLLAQPLPYLYPFGGGNKGNRVLMELLAGLGNDCKVFTPLQPWGGGDRSSLIEALRSHGAPADPTAAGVTARLNGVELHAVEATGSWHAYLTRLTEDFRPDVILVSEDRSLALLQAVLPGGSPVVWIAQSPIGMPFGHGAHWPPGPAVKLMHRLAGIVTLSRYMASYVARWTGIEGTVIRVPVYGPGPFLPTAKHGGRYVTLINPCAIKGLPIFLELAEARPELLFAAVPAWATTPSDIRALRRMPNVTILPPSADVDTIYAQTRVLLVPSLWLEAFGHVAVEAMLRGIPVLASDVGGLPEAKLGVDYVVGVRGIDGYDGRVDEVGLPVPVVPPQDTGPWLAALRDLDDDQRYQALSRQSSEAAASFANSVTIGPMAEYLSRLRTSA